MKKLSVFRKCSKIKEKSQNIGKCVVVGFGAESVYLINWNEKGMIVS